jgi:hypothetical protein
VAPFLVKRTHLQSQPISAHIVTSQSVHIGANMSYFGHVHVSRGLVIPVAVATAKMTSHKVTAVKTCILADTSICSVQSIVCRINWVGRCQQEGGRSLSPLVATRAQRRSWGARPTIYRYRMPGRLEDAAEIVCAALIGYVAEIESASVNKGDAWASKVDADQLRSIKMTLNNWGRIDDWTLDSEASAKIHELTAVTL